ncbi:hypothetical protein G7Y79_00044g080690 [Physcia stellaris]|nr:hypothetical protein G7Y79_00044g080690 [Physcia stellaris]
MGKPPRERLRTAEEPTKSGAASQHQSSHASTRSKGFNEDSTAGDGQYDNLHMSVDGLNVMNNDMFGPLVPNFTSLDFGNTLSSSMEAIPLSTWGSPIPEDYSSPTTRTEVSQFQLDEGTKYLNSALLSSVGSKGHDCFREAYAILGGMSAHSLNNALSSDELRSDLASTTPSHANQVPLDHILRYNRDASERLGRVLTCSCGGSSRLALLCASIISHILIWYQHSAGCTQIDSWGPGTTELPAVSHPAYRTGSLSGSGSSSEGGSSTWSSTLASGFSADGSASTSALTQSTRLAVTPAKMAIGNFDVDDLRVQTALKIQLLSGEMRRAGRLIDQFASRNTGSQCSADDHTFGAVNNLCQSLESWLRGEHSRIANMMRSKLRELNT